MRVLSIILCWLAFFAAVPSVHAAQAKDAPAGNRTWHIAYLEGGGFSDYCRVLQGIAQSLEANGVIANGKTPLPRNADDTRAMWDWLAAHAGGDRLEFLADGFYSAHWDADLRSQAKGELLRRIREKGDVDLVLALGTWAGQDLAQSDINVPVVVSSVSDAVEAGIIPSAKDSGRDNLTAAIELNRTGQQIMLFHDIFHFKKLGIAYEDTPSGRSSVALQSIEQAAKELGVELVRCTEVFDVPDAALATQRLLTCHEKFAKEGADAVYLAFNTGMQEDSIPDLLEPFIKAGIPTFSQAGSNDVAHGALLSISQAALNEEGLFNGNVVASIMRGAKPRSLPQTFATTISLSINLRTATLIGWNPPLEILAAVDEVYGFSMTSETE